MYRIITILSFCFLTSCGYSVVKQTSTDGHVFRERFYNNSERHDRYFNSRMFNAWYSYHLYEPANSLVLLNDSTATSDSIIFQITSSDYRDLFLKGIISGSVFDSITGNLTSLEMIDVETGKVIPPQKNYFFYIWDLKLLNQFKLSKNRARFRFETNLYTYFIEIESKYSKQDTSITQFIRNSRLVFIHKCCGKI